MTPRTQPSPALVEPMPRIHLAEVRTTRRDRVVSVLLALLNVPVFGYVCLVAFIWGPEQFFGEYSNAAGRQAVDLLALAVVAAAAWASFFASYARARGANVLGLLVTGAAVAVDVLLLVEKVRSLRAHHADRGLPDSDPTPWSLYAALAAWALLAALSAAAMRHPRLRWIAAAPIAAVGIAGFALLAEELLAGGVASVRILVVAAPLVAAFLLIDVVFPDRTRAGLEVSRR